MSARKSAKGNGKPVGRQAVARVASAAKVARTPKRSGATRGTQTGALRVLVVVHEDAQGGFWAEVPALPGCVTEGETRDELLENLRDAIEGCLLTPSGTFKSVEDGGTPEELRF